MSGARSVLRLASYRLRANRLSLLLACAVGALVALGLCFELEIRVALYAKDPIGGASMQGGPTLGDFLAFLLAGVKQPDPIADVVAAVRTLRIPFGWLALVLVPAVATAMLGTEESLSIQPLVESRSRWAHWLGGCLALLVGCAAYWLLVVGACMVATLAVGGELAPVASNWLPDVAGFARETTTYPPYGMGLFVATAVLTSCSLAQVQHLLAEMFGRRAAFLALAAYLAASVFAMHPAFLGNFLMAARSAVFVVGHQVEVGQGFLQAGLEPVWAMVVSGALLVASPIVGGLVARYKDYLGGGIR